MIKIWFRLSERWWKKYLVCNECWVEKELTWEFWNKDSRSELWYIYKCKECLHKNAKKPSHKYYLSHKQKVHEYNVRYRREHREELRDKRRLNRKSDEAWRKKNMKEISKKTNAHAKKMWYIPVHDKVYRAIKKLWNRPKKCPMCWYKWLVVAHHPDYSKRYEVVFCCNSCHSLIHKWEIQISNDMIVLLSNNQNHGKNSL